MAKKRLKIPENSLKMPTFNEKCKFSHKIPQMTSPLNITLGLNPSRIFIQHPKLPLWSSSAWRMKHLGSTGMLWTVPVCSGQYRYALGSTGLFLEPVCSEQYRYVLGSTSMIWAVPVCSGQYRYCPEHTGTVQNIPVPKPNQYCPEHTGTAQSIPVLSRAYRYYPGVSSFRLKFDDPCPKN